MTHSIDAPFPPPPAATDYSGASTSSSPSTTDVAKDETKNLGQSAAQAGTQVASTAAGQAQEVVHETRRQAQDLLEQGRSQVREQAVSQQQKAAQGLSSLADELRGLLNGDGTSASGPAHDLLHQATGKVEELASWLQNREPADLLDEVRSFARRKPGTFLIGAAIAGVLAGRLTSGVKAAHTDSGPSGRGTAGYTGGQQYAGGTGYPTTNYVDPTPAYSGYGETVGTGAPAAYGDPVGGAPLPPPPYGTVPPAGSVVPPTTPAGWDDPTRSPGGVG